jgi:WD40 repeat protein
MFVRDPMELDCPFTVGEGEEKHGLRLNPMMCDPLVHHHQNQHHQEKAYSNFDVLPNEVIVLIFGHLDAHELLSISSTCQNWRLLAEEETLWKLQVVRSCRSIDKAHDLLKRYFPLHAASSKEVDRERATGHSRWKSVWLARKKTRHNWRHAAFKRSILAKQHTASIFCLAFDDEHILTGSSDHSALVWDINSGEPLRKLDAHQFAVWNVKLIGKLAITASYDSTIRLWDVTTGKNTGLFSGHASAIWGLDSLGTKIVSSSTDTFLLVWDMESSRQEFSIQANQDTVWCCQFIDQNTIATGGSDIKIWDLRINNEGSDQRSPVMNFTGHRDAIRCLQADSRRVVSGSYDSTAGVWDMAAGKRLWELKGHTDSITTLQFDESDMLVTSSFDQSFRVWDIKLGSRLAAWKDGPESAQSEVKGGKVYALRFDDHRLITGREDCRIRIDDFSARSLC